METEGQPGSIRRECFQCCGGVRIEQTGSYFFVLRNLRKIRIGLCFLFCGVIFPIVLTDFFLTVTETLSAAFQSYVSHGKRSRRR